MSEYSSRRLRHGFQVPLPPDEAFPLFTPRGEREWAPHWDPQFPARVDDDSQPGTVFTVLLGDSPSTWIVTHSDPGREIQYARVIPERSAALVTASCAPSGPGTTVTVTYEVTALSAQGEEALLELADGFVEYIAGWEAAILEVCRRRGRPSPDSAEALEAGFHSAGAADVEP